MFKYADAGKGRRPSAGVKSNASEALFRSNRDGSLHSSSEAIRQHHRQLDTEPRPAWCKRKALPIERENALVKLAREVKA